MNVSIIVRSYNNERIIQETLRCIRLQNYKNYEIVLVDSNSSDQTVNVSRPFVDKVVTTTGEYLPAKSLKAGIEASDGEIIVFNNSDCIPENQDWLENLIKPLRENPSVGACFGNQLAREDAWGVVVKDHERAFGDGSYNSKWDNFFSLATSAARKEVLEKVPFSEHILYSEDVEWAYRLKGKGYQIQYCADAKVFHSHNYTPSELFVRFFNEGVADSEIFTLKRQGFISFAKGLLAEVFRDVAFLVGRQSVGELEHSFKFRFIQRIAYFLGNNFSEGNYLKRKAL